MMNSAHVILNRLPMSIGVSLLMLVGCSHESATRPSASTSAPTTAEAHEDHPSEGPHNGELVELGNEEYHIEIIHDEEAPNVTAYILDSSAKIAAPIGAKEILVNLSYDGQAEQFALVASPQSSDPEGKSSRFESTEAELAQDLDNEAVTAQLTVEIDGKQYRGAISHDHGPHDSHEDATHAEHDR